MPQLRFALRLPFEKRWAEGGVLLYDRRLRDIDGFVAWSQKFHGSWAVDGGERTKAFEQLPQHLEELWRRANHLGRRLTLVACGGGSITDLAGFLAHIYRRGVDLVLLPSTWLAALDSAHGGKNGLNFNGVKNQIGTFYFPRAVYVVRQLLWAQDEARMQDALGEVAKMFLLKRLSYWSHELVIINKKTLWRTLPQLVAAKYSIVARDPFETTAIRQQLNLGHTFGHVLEIAQGWPHGEAVAQGLFFSFDMSVERGFLSAAHKARLENELLRRFNVHRRTVFVKAGDFHSLVTADKKSTGAGKINFVYPRGIGRVRVEPTAVADLLKLGKRCAWIR